MGTLVGTVFSGWRLGGGLRRRRLGLGGRWRSLQRGGLSWRGSGFHSRDRRFCSDFRSGAHGAQGRARPFTDRAAICNTIGGSRLLYNFLKNVTAGCSCSQRFNRVVRLRLRTSLARRPAPWCRSQQHGSPDSPPQPLRVCLEPRAAAAPEYPPRALSHWCRRPVPVPAFSYDQHFLDPAQVRGGLHQDVQKHLSPRTDLAAPCPTEAPWEKSGRRRC